MPDQLTKRNTTPATAPAANRPVPARSATAAPANTPTRPGAATATRSSASTGQAKAATATQAQTQAAQPSSLLETATQLPANRPGQGVEEQATKLQGQNIHQGIHRLSDTGNEAGNNEAAGTETGSKDAELIKALDTHNAQKMPPTPASWIVRLLELTEQRGEAGRLLLAEEIAREVSPDWAKSVAARLGELPAVKAGQINQPAADTTAAKSAHGPIPGSVGQKNQAAQPLTDTAPRTAQMQLEVASWLEETDQHQQTQSKPTAQGQSQHQQTKKQIQHTDLAERQLLMERAARIFKATGLQTVTPVSKWLNLQFYQLREATRKLTNGWEPEEIRDWLELKGDQPLWRDIVRVYRSPHLVGPEALKTAGQQNAAALHVVMALWIEAREAAENSTQRPTAQSDRY